MTNDEKILDFLETLQSDVTLMKGDISSVKSEIVTKADLTVVKADLAEVKSDIAVVKADLAEVKSDLTAVKSDLTAVKMDVQEVQGEQVSMFEFLKENVATKRDIEEGKSEMMAHVDGLAAHNQKFDQELLMIRNRQDRLEARMA